ncbi:hypothetical protein PL10110_240020 [Planktothrix agardhii]|nr:hypothetical protein PL10110_240020 [Planktothrix agardhii]
MRASSLAGYKNQTYYYKNQTYYSNPKSVVIFPSISTPPNPPLSKGRARVGFYILIANHLRLLYYKNQTYCYKNQTYC